MRIRANSLVLFALYYTDSNIGVAQFSYKGVAWENEINLV